MMMSHLITTLQEILFAGTLLKWHNSFKDIIINENIRIYS